MNLLQTRTLVRTMLSEDTAAYWTDAMLTQFINRAFLNVYTKMANLRRGYFETSGNITYVASQELYTLPSVTMKIVLVERVDGLVPQPVNIRPIDIIQKNEYAQMPGIDMTPGREKYFITGNSIGIAPVPRTAVTNALKIWYVPVPTLMSADGDVFPTEMTDAHHDLIAFGAFMRAVMRDKQALAQILPIYTELKADLLNDAQVREQQEPPQIIDTDPYDM